MARLILLFIAVAFISCSKDDVSTGGKELKLKAVELNGEKISEYTYDEEGKLLTATSFSDGQVQGSASYMYDSDSIIVSLLESDFTLRGYTKYIRLGQELISRQGMDLEGDVFDDFLYYYDDVVCGLTKIEDLGEEDLFPTIVEYSYLDANCSYNRVGIYSNGDLDDLTEVIKDDNMNPSPSPLEYFEIPNSGNVIKRTRFNAYDGLVNESWSYQAEVTFNDEGYPITIVQNYVDGDLNTYDYIYY